MLDLQSEYGNQAVENLLTHQYQAELLPTPASTRIQRARNGGEQLPPGLRRRMERRMGGDLGTTRVHTGQEADQLSRSVSARAFTVGNDIFFRNGAFDTHSRGGLETLAHELVHVRQQGGKISRSANLRLGKADDHFEKKPAGSHAFMNGNIGKYRHGNPQHAATAGTVQRIRINKEALEELAEMPGSVASGTGNAIGKPGNSLWLAVCEIIQGNCNR